MRQQDVYYLIMGLIPTQLDGIIASFWHCETTVRNLIDSIASHSDKISRSELILCTVSVHSYY